MGHVPLSNPADYLKAVKSEIRKHEHDHDNDATQDAESKQTAAAPVVKLAVPTRVLPPRVRPPSSDEEEDDDKSKKNDDEWSDGESSSKPAVKTSPQAQHEAPKPKPKPPVAAKPWKSPAPAAGQSSHCHVLMFVIIGSSCRSGARQAAATGRGGSEHRGRGCTCA